MNCKGWSFVNLSFHAHVLESEDCVSATSEQTHDRFKGTPYHCSFDLITDFRKEAKTAEQQALMRDLFEWITVYDLKADEAKISLCRH